MRFGIIRIKWNAIDWAYLTALRGIKMPNALGAFIGIDFINLNAHINRIVWAFWFTDIAINAFVCNH